jgi:intracellular multiplication protein IcmE
MAQDPQDDVVDIPAGDVDEGEISSSRRTTGMSRPIKFALGATVGMMALALAMTFQNTAAQTGASAVVRPPALDTTPGGDTQLTNQRFQESLLQANDERAQMATDLGVTFLPTPENVLTPIAKDDKTVVEVVVTDVEPEVVVEPPVVVERRTIAPPPPVRRPVMAEEAPQEQQRVAVQQTAPSGQGGGQQEEENPYLASISGQMNAVSRTFAMPTASLTQVNKTADKTRAMTAAQAAEGATTASGASVPTAADAAATGTSAGSGGEVILRPGDILYAETITSVNSDAPTQVLAEITTGEFKGARLVGTFAKPESADGLVVEFSAMTLESGETIAMSGYAVDGRTAETAVASDVDRRYVKRYGPVFGATFLSAFAGAAAAPSQTMSSDGDVVTAQSTTREAALAGVSSAMGQVAGDLMASAPKGPKITLRSGYPLGILIMEPVENPN